MKKSLIAAMLTACLLFPCPPNGFAGNTVESNVQTETVIEKNKPETEHTESVSSSLEEKGISAPSEEVKTETESSEKIKDSTDENSTLTDTEAKDIIGNLIVEERETTQPVITEDYSLTNTEISGQGDLEPVNPLPQSPSETPSLDTFYALFEGNPDFAAEAAFDYDAYHNVDSQAETVRSEIGEALEKERASRIEQINNSSESASGTEKEAAAGEPLTGTAAEMDIGREGTAVTDTKTDPDGLIADGNSSAASEMQPVADQMLIDYINNNEHYNAAAVEVQLPSENEMMALSETTEDSAEGIVVEPVNNPYFTSSVNGASVSAATRSLNYEKAFFLYRAETALT